MQRQVIKPQLDVPVVIHLDQGPEGKEKQGPFGIDYQYTVNHNSGVMWLPTEGRNALYACGAQAGDDVQIVKTMKGKQVFFSAHVVSDAAEPVAAPPPPPVARVNGRGGALPQRAYYQPAPQTAAPARQVAPQEETRITPVAAQLAGCFCAAIDAALEAETYAKSKGMEIEFNAEDLRAIALSVYIGAQRNGGMNR